MAGLNEVQSLAFCAKRRWPAVSSSLPAVHVLEVSLANLTKPVESACKSWSAANSTQ